MASHRNSLHHYSCRHYSDRFRKPAGHHCGQGWMHIGSGVKGNTQYLIGIIIREKSAFFLFI